MTSLPNLMLNSPLLEPLALGLLRRDRHFDTALPPARTLGVAGTQALTRCAGWVVYRGSNRRRAGINEALATTVPTVARPGDSGPLACPMFGHCPSHAGISANPRENPPIAIEPIGQGRNRPQGARTWPRWGKRARPTTSLAEAA